MASADTEARLFERHAAGDFGGLAEAIVETYGGEILGYMIAILRDADAAQDVFQTFCEELLRSLPGFRGESTFRTWLYVIARRRVARRGRDRPAVPLSRSPEIERLAALSRSRTAPHLRTDVKSSIRRLRERLSEEEQTLLILRVDRGLDWRDIARVLGEGAEPTAADTARIRKRFQRTKDKLRDLAQEAGLLPSEDDP